MATRTAPHPPRTGEPRVERLSAGDAQRDALIRRLIDVSIAGLARMFRPEQNVFAFRRERTSHGDVVLKGTSVRYGAITLLGARFLSQSQQRAIFGGESAEEFCRRLIAGLRPDSNLGDAALITWAAAELQLAELAGLLEWLRRRDAAARPCFTVEAAWVLSALSAAAGQADVAAAARRAGDRLLAAFNRDAGVFPYCTDPQQARWARRHVSCFADQVYPIQALARFHQTFGDGAALAVAERCAAQICRVQGPAGQWWWHYDARHGAVIEGYPVYTVHQDAMAPMALLDLHEAGGPDHGDAIRAGLAWMETAAEVGHTLIDDELALIWRKVARTGPRKFVRSVRAGLSRIHPRLRASALDRVFPPAAIDYEDRPYHLGWILFTWLGCLR